MYTDGMRTVIPMDTGGGDPPCVFRVADNATDATIAYIDFQPDPCGEQPGGGLADGCVLAMIRARLAALQHGDRACAQYAEALHHVEHAMVALEERLTHEARTDTKETA